MKVSIVIPVLNEQTSIKGVIDRCLEFRKEVVHQGVFSDVELVVVSDGSTDDTVKIAEGYRQEVEVIIFEKNRGYGAAIKHGFEVSSGDLLGFMDGDGTCDPFFFAELAMKLEDHRADIAIGSRLNDQSKMPPIRRLGNKFFSILLSSMAGEKIKDTASGMRLLKRDSLKDIFPLPDGLHFTPAMSARAIMNQNLKLVEVEMPYHERQGVSKLSILRDGLRFLGIILKTIALYKPRVFLNSLGLLSLILGALLMVSPVLHYLSNTEVAEWMIYRFVTFNLLILGSTLFFSVSYLIEKILSQTIIRSNEPLGNRLVNRFFNNRYLLVATILTMAGGYLLVHSSVSERIITGHTDEHWSRFLTMSALMSAALVLIATKVVDYFLTMIFEYLNYRASYEKKQT